MGLLKTTQQRTAEVDIDAMHLTSTFCELLTFTLINIYNTHFILEYDVLWHFNSQTEHVKLDMLVLFYLFPILCSNTLVWLRVWNIFIIKTETELFPLH